MSAAPTTSRRLAAIVVADVVGYSRLLNEDEAATLAALRERRKAVVEPLTKQHTGRVVKFLGDGVLLEFSSAVNAVVFALDLQHRMAEMNEPVAEGRRIRLRVGINLGEVVGEGADIFGDGVNIASRLEAIAEPGGIAISGKVHEEIEGKIDATFADLGEQALKNIARPVKVWLLSTGTQDLAPPIALPLPDRPSVAVLPFQNMSGDVEQSFFSDGITEDIITELSKFRSLFVIARNSTFQYRDKAVDIRRVARDLGVQYVVEGSVRRVGNQLRVTAQLIDATAGSHVWADRYDRPLDDLFAVEQEITQTIVSTLAGRLEEAEFDRTARRPTTSMAAYDCLLRAIVHLRGYGKDDNRLGRELCEQAVSIDPAYALAHGYLGLTLIVEHGYAASPEPIKQRALEYTQRAVRLAPSDSRCHWLTGIVYGCLPDFDLAHFHLERSNALNPNDANCLQTWGALLGQVGRFDEGIHLMRLAMRLNPFHPEWYWVDLAMTLYAARDYREALKIDQRLVVKKRPYDMAHAAACLAQLGRLSEARALARQILEVHPEFHISMLEMVAQRAADAEHLAEGMRKAGLPE
jgi:TolB-like protein/class 3 adenylate cyclase/Flp pilus assembly protein TadD